MNAPVALNCLEVEQVGDVTLAKFTTSRLLDEEQMEMLGRELLGLADEARGRPLVVSFNAVTRLSSTLLGQLLVLQRRLHMNGGKLAVCQVPEHAREIFALLKLPQTLPIYADEQEALQALS